MKQYHETTQKFRSKKAIGMQSTEHSSNDVTSSVQQGEKICTSRRQHDSQDVVSKSSGRASSCTPRNLVVPDLTDTDKMPLPISPFVKSPFVPGAARKYIHTDDPSSQLRAIKIKAITRLQAPRSLRGRLYYYCGDRKGVAGAARSARRALSHLSFQQRIAFFMLLAGMLSESGTPAPRYNVPIAVSLIIYPLVTEDDAIPCEYHRIYNTGLALATVIDFLWLMRPQEKAFNGYFEESLKSFTDVWIALCAFAKISLISCSYLELIDTELPLDDKGGSSSKAFSPSPPSFHLWNQLKFFFPRRTLPRRAQLSLEVLHRVLVLTWIHLTCGLLLFALGLISTAFYSERTQFRVSPLGIPLYVMLLLKSATTLLTFFTVSYRINYDACLELYGLRSRDFHTKVREGNGSQLRLPQQPVLAYNRTWLHRVQRAKAVDGIAGCYLLLVFYTALRSGQAVGGRGVSAMLVCIALVQLILDVWTPLLILVVGRCGIALYALHRRGIPGTDPLFPPQLCWDESDEEDEDSDDTRASDNGSADSSLSSSSDDSAKKSPAERRARRHCHRLGRPEEECGYKREHRLPIVDVDAVQGDQTARSASDIATAREIVELGNTSGKGAWVRHWHEISARAYLVHSITGETVWEAPSNVSKPLAPVRQSTVAREIVKHDRFKSSQHLFEAYDERWHKLVDGGGFNCRISRIPDSVAFAQHLRAHGFIVVSDGLNVYEQRTVFFFAQETENLEIMFMGEFVFDSLSLKLRARFRCAEPEQVIQFVKRLLLKEVVGAYAPCE